MANRHFAKVADVWKHLALAEVIAIERPARYWESHAGNASYRMADDAERRYGALHLFSAASGWSELDRSRYLARLRESVTHGEPPLPTTYPASPLLAMRELGPSCEYVFCDLDGNSVLDLATASDRLGLSSNVRSVEADGMATIAEALRRADDPARALAHVDPYDPRLPGPSGLSAIGLAGLLVTAGAGLVYWYGYDRSDRRCWASGEIADAANRGTSGTSLWCGDILVTAADGSTLAGGDLGLATTPGTGFGIVCANVSERALEACRALGEELVHAYDGVPLPDGSAGGLDFFVTTTG